MAVSSGRLKFAVSERYYIMRLSQYWLREYTVSRDGFFQPFTSQIFKARITPENATEPEIIWSVEPGFEHIVEIDENGLATIIGEGEGRIRATLAYDPQRYLIALIYGTSGVDSIFANSDGPWSVYSVSGVLLINKATMDDIRKLQPGLYIIGGKLLLLTRK